MSSVAPLAITAGIPCKVGGVSRAKIGMLHAQLSAMELQVLHHATGRWL